MSIQRRYSKSKAVGGHVVWTPEEVQMYPVHLDGLLFDGAEFGVLQVEGRDVICSGFRVDFRVPARDREIVCYVGLYTGNSILVPGGRAQFLGTTTGGFHAIEPNIPMPTKSIWKFILELSHPDEDSEETEDLYPEGIRVTYYLRYANSPVVATLYSQVLTNRGVGFDAVGSTLIVH